MVYLPLQLLSRARGAAVNPTCFLPGQQSSGDYCELVLSTAKESK